MYNEITVESGHNKKTVCICSVDRMCYKKRYNAAVVDRILYLDNKAKLQQFLG